jgi:hypothetical protein
VVIDIAHIGAFAGAAWAGVGCISIYEYLREEERGSTRRGPWPGSPHPPYTHPYIAPPRQLRAPRARIRSSYIVCGGYIGAGAYGSQRNSRLHGASAEGGKYAAGAPTKHYIHLSSNQAARWAMKWSRSASLTVPPPGTTRSSTTPSGGSRPPPSPNCAPGSSASHTL